MSEAGAKREVVELRCPSTFGKLLGKIISAGVPLYYDDDNLLELTCADCRKQFKEGTGTKVKMVLHKFNIIGELVETEVVRY